MSEILSDISMSISRFKNEYGVAHHKLDIHSAKFQFTFTQMDTEFHDYWRDTDTILDRLTPIIRQAESGIGQPKIFLVESGNNEVAYDVYDSHVVLAYNAAHAKLVVLFEASEADDTADDWINSNVASLADDGKTGVIHSSFRAG